MDKELATDYMYEMPKTRKVMPLKIKSIKRKRRSVRNYFTNEKYDINRHIDNYIRETVDDVIDYGLFTISKEVIVEPNWDRINPLGIVEIAIKRELKGIKRKQLDEVR